ncbi:hypothetical protein [Microbacterium oleivorans]|uniref:Uncharacterized protein n=1 Tax=Microbacterium oleivorans TaxID=273677 RepID=A0A177KD83_9MICO|nr:hypothetical protein [Microbacterium oleivorans]OAH51369.1 hypothetical protein AYL44_03640 [Microbacterium oleivorans]
MIWDAEAYLAKAQNYFQRGASRPSNEESLVWSVLGLEFLARAALAKVSPVLNAAMEGPAILDSLGFPDPQGKRIQSVPMHTVLVRLPIVVADFTPDRVKDFEYLLELRNAELHTAAVRWDEPVSSWLPKLTRTIEPLARHLGTTVENLLGDELSEQGRQFVDSDDKKLLQEVRTRINSARDFWSRLTEEEKEARQPSVFALGGWKQKCSACDSAIIVDATPVRSSRPYIDDDGDTVSKVEYVITGASCNACGLVLTSTGEVHAAGMPQTFDEIEVQELAPEQPDYVDYDYGND